MDGAGRKEEEVPPIAAPQTQVSKKERKRSKSVESRASSLSSEMDTEVHKGARRRSRESKIAEEDSSSVDQRISKAIEEEDAFLDYIRSLPAMSSERVEAYMKSQEAASRTEATGGLEHLENLYRLMEQLGQLKVQNSKLQERVKYLETMAHEEEEEEKHSRSKRSTKCKSSHYGIKQTFMRSRERSRSVGVEEILKSTSQYRLAGEGKSKVSKWTKVKEAFRWEKASNGVLPEAKSQDSGLGTGDDVRFLRVPQAVSDSSSPADSVGQGGGNLLSSSASTSDDDLEDADTGLPACQYRREYLDSKRSKSLDGEVHLMSGMAEQSDVGKDIKNSPTSHKGMKTPWGKMKDIIQTRAGSVKKKKGESDVEDDTKSGVSAGETQPQDLVFPDSETPCDGGCDPGLRRRLAPTLTITLPSTEELRGVAVVSTKPPPSPQTDARTCARDRAEQAPRKVSGGSAGTSPPTPRRLSKWSKVKNAFLTSGAQSEDCLQASHRGSSSVPSSPVKSANFTYDIESDELSSGEFMEDSTRDDDVFPEPSDDMCDVFMKNDNIQAEIQRNYEELQQKLSQEFHKKLCEWERMKSSSPGTPPCTSRVGGSGFSSGTSSVGDDSPHDKGFRRKMEEWEKMKSPGSSKHRESVTLQQLGEENLSPDFKKKLEEWEKIKSTPVPQTPDIVNSQPQFKKKITEWQLWRPGVVSSKSDVGISSIATPPAELPEDFYKKLQEWERLKHGPQDTPETSGNRTPSPGACRRECDKHGKKGADFGFQLRIQKSKSHHEVKELAWLEKELHKIEREKQRLERERDKYLEREARLEKLRKAIGASLKKQEILIPTSTGLFRFEGISQKFTRKLYEWEKARGIGPEASTFALLDPGYQPPSPASGDHSEGGGCGGGGSMLTRSKSVGSVVDMSVVQSSLTHQPSSLSLTHMDQLDSCALTGEGDEPQAVIVDVEDEVVETAAPLAPAPAAQPHTAVYCYAPSEVTRLIDSSGSDSDREARRGVQAQSSIELLQENISLLDRLQRKEDICRELECKIEDVEDKLHTTERIHREHLGTLVSDTDNLGTSFEKEYNMEEIKEKLLELESQKKELLEEEVTLQHSFVEHSEQQALIAQDLVGKVRQLQDNISTQQTATTATTEQTHSFVEHSEQQALIAQDLVGKVRQLQDNISTQQTTTTATTEPGQQTDQDIDSITRVHDLTSQLIQLAEQLERAAAERSRELCLLRKAVTSVGASRGPGARKLRPHQHWFSTDSVASVGVQDDFPVRSSEDLAELPVILTSKLQELKTCLGSLTPPAEFKTQPAFSNKRVLNVISPESPEVETTFVFNIRKKSATQILDSQDEVLKTNTSEDEKQIHEIQETRDLNLQPSLQENATSNLTPLEDEASASVDYWEKINEKSHEIRKVEDNSCKTETIVEFTYPLKTYFKEEPREKRFKKKYGQVLPDSDETDSDDKSTKSKALPIRRGSTENIDYENVQENSTVKKYKRNRNNSGLYERRRSRTDSKEENSDEDVGGRGLFDSCTSKKCINYDERYRKSSSKPKSSTRETESGNTSLGVSEEAAKIPADHEIDTNEGSIKPLHSPKCISRRLKKAGKNLKESKNTNDGKCMSYNFCCNAQNEEVVHNQEMTVNVFVPTTRKIFSPVRKDSKGETSSIIGYVVEESLPGGSYDNELPPDQHTSDEQGGVKKNNDDANVNEEKCSDRENAFDNCKKDGIVHHNDLEDISKNYENNDKIQDDEKPKFDFIMPPCWIIKQVRAQSASPALQRRTIRNSLNRENTSDRDNSDKTRPFESKKDSKTEVDKSKIVPSSTRNVSSSNTNNKHKDLSMNIEEKGDNNSLSDIYSLRENCRKNSSSSESVETSRSVRKEGNSIPSSLKLRSEAGFPPISPLTVRREMKVMKETAPSIRMMIAKYNQKVHESQEMSGTKSPDSGTQSPVAWRSPIAERRIKSQMEKYQEEVRKAFQTSSKTDFYPYAVLGQVQKSASAGYIRPFEKECSSESINDRSESKSLSQPSHGILKSSSVGAIKSMSPLPPKRHIITSPNLSAKRESSILSDLQNKPEPTSQNCKSVTEIGDVKLESNPRISDVEPAYSRCEKMKLSHIPPIPTVLFDEGKIINELETSPESTRLRALRIKKAKEEFLQRGCVRDSSQSAPSTPGTPSQTGHRGVPWTDSKSRLSQISCGSESSYENVPMILVSGKDSPRDQEGALLVKSASAGMINVDSSSTSGFSGSQRDQGDQGAIPKSKSGILSRFRKARLKRHKDKDQKLGTVSTLCRQSLVVDINKRNQNGEDSIPSSSKSCPSSPVLHKKDQTNSGSWIRNPRRIFKPK